MYIAIERQATGQLSIANSSLSLVVPSILTMTIENKKIFLAFLTRKLAFRYLKSLGEVNEFKIVTPYDISLKGYQVNIKRIKEFSLYEFYLVIDLLEKDGRLQPVFFETAFSPHDVFCKEEAIKNIIFDKSPELKKIAIQDDLLTEREIVGVLEEKNKDNLINEYKKNLSENVG